MTTPSDPRSTISNAPGGDIEKVRRGVQKGWFGTCVPQPAPPFPNTGPGWSGKGRPAGKQVAASPSPSAVFFRDQRMWHVLKTSVLPALIRKHPKRLRVWSAGCARGEEP
ncbi:MAG: CheR family methyltransferase [Desulfococcaceae bacterium]